MLSTGVGGFGSLPLLYSSGHRPLDPAKGRGGGGGGDQPHSWRQPVLRYFLFPGISAAAVHTPVLERAMCGLCHVPSQARPGRMGLGANAGVCGMV